MSSPRLAFPRFLAGLGPAALLLGWVPALLQEESTEQGVASALAVHEALRSLDELETTLEQERALVQREQEDQAARLALLEADARDQRAIVAAQREALAGLEREQAEIELELQVTGRQARIAAQQAAELARRLVAGAEGAIPWLRDRRAPLSGLVVELEQDHGGVDAILALLEHLSEELPAWSARLLDSRPVRLPGGEVELHAWTARLGIVGEWFLGEDGRIGGMAACSPGRPWLLLPPDVVEGTLAPMIAELRGERPPSLRPVPVHVEGATDR